MIALYLGVSAEGRLQDVGEFGVPERNVKSITLQRTEHLKGREKTTTQTPKLGEISIF